MIIPNNRKSFLFVLFLSVLTITFLVSGSLAQASSEYESDSGGSRIEVRKEERKTVTQSPPVRRIAPRPAAPGPAPPTSSKNSGVGNSVSRSNVSRLPSAFPEGGSVARAACTVSQFFGGAEDFCPSPAPAAPAAPAPAPAPAPQTEVVSEPVTITITTSDLLELIPSSPQILMDRGPFGLKNAHTNFYASHHEPQTITQTMFDQEVTITATPVEYRWDYGDGNTLVTDLPGYPVDIFNTETDTSHQFAEPGVYTVELTTVFEGTFQVDGGEVQEVSAPVTQQADPIELRIYSAVTRNVDQTCLENPDAWGCDAPAE